MLNLQQHCSHKLTHVTDNMAEALLHRQMMNISRPCEQFHDTITTITFVLMAICSLVRWLGSLMVRAMDPQLDGRRFNSRPPQQILGWVTIFWRANHPGQLSLLPSVGWGMSNSQCGDALQLGVKYRYGSFHLWIKVWKAGKTV